jgi:hypothetical protein
MAKPKKAPGKAGGSPNDALVGLHYMGHYRKPVKTSVAKAPITRFNDLGALLDSLRSDNEMRKTYKLKARTIQQKRNPPKGAIGPTARFPEEMKNVSVPCWISAVKFETGQTGSDNDCHVILSNTARVAKTTRFMTCEVSGLPDSGNAVAAFKAVRQQLVKLFSTTKLSNRFYKPSPPIKVRVTGSLFFDGDHVAGNIGPLGMRPNTTWEIHPVTAIAKG